ncbi:E2/UBC family protein [Paludibaculum fermentans]|uniref:E2/UBC family protein n=1 Tax=Paludibaculum fermentans TaxID=1473598 RepID=UPI003EBDD178
MSSTEAAQQLLSDEDRAHLELKGYEYDVSQTNGLVHVIIKNFNLPPIYTPNVTDLLLRLPPNFPLAKPDMFWTFPHVRLANGAFPNRADQFDVSYQDRQWQRWSRHFEGNSWRPGSDNLRSFLATIRGELEKGA